MASEETEATGTERDDDPAGPAPAGLRVAGEPGRRRAGGPARAGKSRGRAAGKSDGRKKPVEILFDEAVARWLKVHCSAGDEGRSALMNRLAASYLKRNGKFKEMYLHTLPVELREDGQTEAA